MKAGLVETFIWAKFQVEIPKYDVTRKIGSYRENSLKILYLPKNKLVARILLGFLSTLWVLPMSKIWAQTEGITWWGSLVNDYVHIQVLIRLASTQNCFTQSVLHMYFGKHTSVVRHQWKKPKIWKSTCRKDAVKQFCALANLIKACIWKKSSRSKLKNMSVDYPEHKERIR